MPVDTFRPRTSSVSSVSMESPVFSAPSRAKRDISLASDYSSSTTSVQEGPHPTIFEADEPDTKQTSRAAPVSPLQDGAAASLLALSLESPTTLQSLATTALTYSRPPEGPLDGAEVLTSQTHSLSRDEYEGDRSRSSSISALSLRTESPGARFASFTDVQSYPVTSQRSPLPPSARRENADSHSIHVQDYRPPSDTHPHPLSPRQSRSDLQRPVYHRSANTFPPPAQEGSWASHDNHRHRRAPALDDGYQSRVSVTLPPSSTTIRPEWHSELPGPEAYGPGRLCHYERDSALTRSDQQRPPVFPPTPSTYGAPIPHDGAFTVGSSRSLLASERQEASSTQYARHEESHQHGVPLWKPASDHSNHHSGSYPRLKEHDQRSPRETRHLREIRPQSNTGRDMGTFRTQQQLSDFQDQPSSRSHGHNHPSRYLDSRVAGEKDPRRPSFSSAQHADIYHSAEVATAATHMSPEYASRALAQGAPPLPAERRREVPYDVQDPASPSSCRQDPESVRARLEFESRMEEQARLRHHQQQQQHQQHEQHHHHQYHSYRRHSVDESMAGQSATPARVPIEQSSRGEVMKMGIPEQESSQSAADMSSPQWSISPQSTVARPIAMPGSRTGSRRSSTVIWQESPRFREALGRDRGTGSSSEEPFLGGGSGQDKSSVSSEGRAELTPLLVAGRKRPSVSMYAVIGDEEAVNLPRSRVGGTLEDPGQAYVHRGPDSGTGVQVESGSASRAAVAYSLDPLYQDGQGSSRHLERGQSSGTHAIEQHEQGVGLGLSGITPPLRYTLPEFPRHQHPLGEHSPVEYHRQHRSEHPQHHQGRTVERHQPYPLYRPMYHPSPPHSQQDVRLYHSHEISASYGASSSHSHQQTQRPVSMPIPHPLGSQPIPQPLTPLPLEWSATDTRALGPQTSRSDDYVDADETLSSGYSELIRDPVRRKYR